MGFGLYQRGTVRHCKCDYSRETIQSVILEEYGRCAGSNWGKDGLWTR